MTSYTPNLNLAKPAAGDTDWTSEINGNWDTLDGTVVGLPSGASGGYVTKSSSNLLFAPDKSNRVFLYRSSKWVASVIPDAGITVGATGLTTSTHYYLYVYDNSGTLTLDLSTTAPTTQNGIYVKTSATDRLLIARCYTDGTGGDVQSSEQQRFINNVYNKRSLALRSYNTNSSWAYTGPISWRQWNNGSGQKKAEFVADGINSLHIILGTSMSGADAILSTAIAVDSTSSYSGDYASFDNYNTSNNQKPIAQAIITPSAGYHYFTCLENFSYALGTILGDSARAIIWA